MDVRENTFQETDLRMLKSTSLGATKIKLRNKKTKDIQENADTNMQMNHNRHRPPVLQVKKIKTNLISFDEFRCNTEQTLWIMCLLRIFCIKTRKCLLGRYTARLTSPSGVKMYWMIDTGSLDSASWGDRYRTLGVR